MNGANNVERMLEVPGGCDSLHKKHSANMVFSHHITHPEPKQPKNNDNSSKSSSSDSGSSCSTKIKSKSKFTSVSIACWNVRSMVISEINVPKTSGKSTKGMHRKADLVAKELERLRINIAAVNEVRWLGNGITDVGKYTFLL